MKSKEEIEEMCTKLELRNFTKWIMNELRVFLPDSTLESTAKVVTPGGRGPPSAVAAQS